ncbi:hypothetical protein AHAS_Ahas11G0250200 [Arachis hypogaea]
MRSSCAGLEIEWISVLFISLFIIETKVFFIVNKFMNFAMITFWVGIKISRLEVHYENFSVEGYLYVGSRTFHTLLNATLNTFESVLGLFLLALFKKREFQILKDDSRILKSLRMIFLLGLSGAEKTTLLLALARDCTMEPKKMDEILFCTEVFQRKYRSKKEDWKRCELKKRAKGKVCEFDGVVVGCSSSLKVSKDDMMRRQYSLTNLLEMQNKSNWSPRHWITVACIS